MTPIPSGFFVWVYLLLKLLKFPLFPEILYVFSETIYVYSEGKGNPHLPITTGVVEEGKINQFI